MSLSWVCSASTRAVSAESTIVLAGRWRMSSILLRAVLMLPRGSEVAELLAQLVVPVTRVVLLLALYWVRSAAIFTHTFSTSFMTHWRTFWAAARIGGRGASASVISSSVARSEGLYSEQVYVFAESE